MRIFLHAGHSTSLPNCTLRSAKDLSKSTMAPHLQYVSTIGALAQESKAPKAFDFDIVFTVLDVIFI